MSHEEWVEALEMAYEGVVLLRDAFRAAAEAFCTRDTGEEEKRCAA